MEGDGALRQYFLDAESGRKLGIMDDTLLAYAVEREQAPAIDPGVLWQKTEARAARAARAHRTVFSDRFGWSELAPKKPGFYYFADCDEDRYVIVEMVLEDGKLEVLYAGSDVGFPPESMDGKWKPVPIPSECLELSEDNDKSEI